MRRILPCLCALFVLGLWQGAASAASMQSANEAYARGEWKAAGAAYKKITESGILNEDLYYNLGNANFRQERLGPAIFDYEQALRIAPNRQDALYNLRLAREIVSARSNNQLRDAERSPWWQRISLYLPIPRSTVLLLLSNFLFFAALLARRHLAKGLGRSGLGVVATFLCIATLLSGLLLAGHVYVNEKVHHGIVIGDRVIMREGPDERLQERGQLHPGLQISVLAQEPAWLLVRLANGVEGWVPRSQVGLFH